MSRSIQTFQRQRSRQEGIPSAKVNVVGQAMYKRYAWNKTASQAVAKGAAEPRSVRQVQAGGQAGAGNACVYASCSRGARAVKWRMQAGSVAGESSAEKKVQCRGNAA